VGDRVRGGREGQGEDEREQPVFQDEFRSEAIAVEIDARGEIVRDAGIESAVLPVRQDVDVEYRRSLINNSSAYGASACRRIRINP
jgi:hypothetical protein